MEIMDQINKFRDDRDWRQFHNAKDLAISINLEAAELLELFQWKNSDEVIANNQDELKEELADILMYTLMLIDDLGLEPVEIIEDKLQVNNRKYPEDKARGNNKKHTEL